MVAAPDDELNGLVERSEEVQDLTRILRNVFGFFVICFNNLSYNTFFRLLIEIIGATADDQFDLNAFILIILSKGDKPNIYDTNKETIPIKGILSYFSDENCPKLINKPKLFFFQTILTKNIVVPKHRLAIPFNSCVLLTYPQKESQTPRLTQCMQAHCHDSPICDIFDRIKEQIRTKGHYVEWQSNLNRHCNTILPTLQNGVSIKEDLLRLDKERQLSLAIWCPVRRQTITFLEQQRDEILKIVQDFRFYKITGSSTSLFVGGTLVAIGLVLIPFSMGASLGFSLAGTAMGAAGTATSLIAAVNAKVKTNRKLMEAHDHIMFDHKISANVNDTTHEYNLAIEKTTGSIATCVSGSKEKPKPGSVRAKVGATAFRTVAILGAQLGGIALLVTAPLDLYQIIKNRRELRESGNGENEKDEIYVWYTTKIEEMKSELSLVEQNEGHRSGRCGN